MKITEKELCEKSQLEGYYVLSSKEISGCYYNIKDLYCRNHKLIIDYFEERINKDIDTVVSIELGGAIIASGLAERLNKSLAIFRKGKPSIGIPYGDCLIIDDVSTSGNSLNIIRKWVLDCGATVQQELVAIDRRKKIKKK